MERNGNRLLNLIEEILDLSKLDANKMQIQENSVHLNQFCRWIFSMFESIAGFQKIKFLLNYQASENLILKIDKNKAEKVLINLLSNAIKFTPAEGHILFQVIEEEKQLKFIVKDTGGGIDAKDLSSVFDRFYQSNNTEQGGTGVGLALSKKFADPMQGDLYVSSKLEEGGVLLRLLFLK